MPRDGAHAELANDADAAALSKEASVRFGRLSMPLPCVTARSRASSLEGVPSHDECDGTRRGRARHAHRGSISHGSCGAALIQPRDGSDRSSTLIQAALADR
jgi:hypothetical protein